MSEVGSSRGLDTVVEQEGNQIRYEYWGNLKPEFNITVMS